MRAITWLGTILLSLLPILASAQNQPEALVQELYVKSGMEKQLQQLPLAIQAAMDQGPLEADRQPKPPQQVIAVMKALAPEAFAPEKLKAVVLREFREKLTAPDLNKILQWLDSPLGRKCTQLEEAASTPEAVAEMRQYAARMKISPPTAKRLKVIQQLDAAVQATQNTVEMFISTQMALVLAINATLPREQQRSPDEISREMEKDRPEIEADMKLATLVSLLQTYQGLTEAEIQQYIKFARSPAGAKFNAVANAAVKQALFEGGIRWGKAIGEALERVKSQTEV